MPTVMILGPSIQHTEPMPGVTPAADAFKGRRRVSFGATATEPGAKVNLKLEAATDPADLMPINVYAFFVQPADSVPAGSTPDWFFKSGAPNASIHVSSADPNGLFSVIVPGVASSLAPYLVQTVIEYSS